MTQSGFTIALSALLVLGFGSSFAQDQQKTQNIPTADFTTSFLVDQSPKEVFDDINNVRGWWSEEIEGSTDKLNGEFTYHYEDVHYCQMRIIEFVPNEKIVWLVKYNYFNFTHDRSEWTGTKIVFEISQKGNKTQLRFTHMGLVPQYECFNICSNAWTQYIQQSLLGLIMTGKGRPNQFNRKVKTNNN
jgi:Activator of Hsp90 ATPase homolog 1-like protein